MEHIYLEQFDMVYQQWLQPKGTTAAEKKGEGGIGRKRTL